MLHHICLQNVFEGCRHINLDQGSKITKILTFLNCFFSFTAKSTVKIWDTVKVSHIESIQVYASCGYDFTSSLARMICVIAKVIS